MAKTLRDKIEADGEVDEKALLDAWINCKLTPDDELRAILRQAYAGMETPAHRDVQALISRAADLLAPKMEVAETALAAARQQSMLRAISVVEDMKDFTAFAVINALRAEMEKES